MFQAMCLANQISITVCFDRWETYWDCLLFPLLWQASNRSYRDARARENTWKEVVSQVTEKTANRNNMQPLSKYKTHPYCCSSFLLPSSLFVNQSKQHFSLHFALIVYNEEDRVCSHVSSCLYEQHWCDAKNTTWHLRLFYIRSILSHCVALCACFDLWKWRVMCTC